MAQQAASKFKIEIDGTPLPEHLDNAIVEAMVENSVNLPDMFRVSIRDPGRQVMDETHVRIGSSVKVSVFSDATPAGERLFVGEVTALEAELNATATTTLIRGFDHSHRLFRGRVTETYRDVSYADVAGRVAKRAGLPTGQIDATPAVHKHVSQGNVTDWQFLNGLAREVGFQVGVNEGKFEFRKPANSSDAPDKGNLETDNPLQLVLGQNLLRFHAIVTSAEQVKEVQVRGWDMHQKKKVLGRAPARSTSAEVALTPADVAGVFAGHDYVGVGTPYEQQVEVDNAALALSEQISGAFAEFEGVARGEPKLRAGKSVSLSLVKAPFDGKYSVTSTRHVYDPHDGYQVWFTVTGRQERSLFGLMAPGAANGSASSPPINGVATALVTDANDPEHLGRVRLQFPWLSDTYVSDWARTVQPGAGKGRGAVVLPEVNDEVLVAFEQGDLRRPFVVGGLHNGIDTPLLGEDLVDGLSGAVRRRGFISKKGGGLVFLDDDAKEGIALFTGDKSLRISLNKTGTTIKVTSGGSVEISGATDVKVKAGTSLALEAGTSIQMKAPTISIKGDGPVEIKGTPIQLN